MNYSQSLFYLIFRIWNYLSSRRHKQFGILLVLLVISSLSEMVSIGAVIPFLGVLTTPEKVFDMPYIQPIKEYLRIFNPQELILPLTLGFIIIAIFTGLIRLLVLWMGNRLSFASGADLSLDIYRKTLYQPYRIHVMRNSSEIMGGILGKASGLVPALILPIINTLGGILIIGTILIALILFNPAISISVFIGFGVIYGIIGYVTRKRLSIIGKIKSEEYTRVIKILQEGLGGVRDILLDGNQAVYCKIFEESDQKFRRASAESAFIGGSPRFLIESFGMILLAIFAYLLSRSDSGLVTVLPLLGAIALGAQRILPILQQVYQSWVTIKGNEKAFWDVLELLDQNIPEYIDLNIKPLKFSDCVRIEDLAFRYHPDQSWVIKDLSFNIYNGDRIGFIGVTGSGKSTLLDIVMALLEPSKGKLVVDNQIIDSNTIKRAWQANIAHVPQSIYLSDSTIAENIAFGISLDQIDFDRVRMAAKQAQIDSHIMSLKDGYNTFVGERGIRLSGGQRQRIGIARALYKEASVIIFDEATSALDNETEKAVIEAIEGLGKHLTVLLVAHRVTTLRNCNKIIELKSGKIFRTGTYNELFPDLVDKT
ncbi:ABC transporter ATP-binding protein [Leptospira kirschneri]|uniref:ABC transporter ATP-binding protein n=1 Tax=Leptospira kirschneri TaxID=29507 RepID=UPI0002785772|nr:ABC transporter ATP-binding protein [Leptospira kirschneri]EJO68954.1 ABC transporter, ATP-binding protein [Leptospira kirschneri serovar Grippotyphosa str. RM52]EKQ82525.1 ABC transporter, ATP-binding protein [Leptospira kirschneri serovar Grippotyphosa str. Moskva]EKR07559.1 ABC transporter, ATP-binding protein [Leptospira kirschneri serovar Valbuzzi str. 200702274]EMK03692.1 ABC transporter, ATP-binding protein [Leptospira kirschneri str. MMD1493]OOV46565.1 ABC transporter ATP-binding pr